MIKTNSYKINNFDISKLTVIEIKKIAKEKGISGISKLKKKDLIREIKKFIESKDIEVLDHKNLENKKEISTVDDFTKISKKDKISLLKEKVRDPKWSLQKKFIDELINKIEIIFINEIKKEKRNFVENGGNQIDFFYKSNENDEFNKIANEYKKIKYVYFQELELQKKTNGELKKIIIENVKKLIGGQDSINTLYKKFKTNQEKWYKIGPALRSNDNDLWETYKHHVERFYDFLHLNRKLRNLDYKHNYDEKIKIINKAELLLQNDDVLKAGRELNNLHRLWKNELGPVDPKDSEGLWNRFQTASKIIHSRKQDYQKNIDKNQDANLERKKIILKKIEKLIEFKVDNHNGWQLSINKFNELREEFKKIGPIHKSKSKKNWEIFRETGREFNQKKNKYYKNQKINQKIIIKKYELLIDEVKSINQQENWLSFSERMKKIQPEFNKLDFIPRNILKKFRFEFQKETNLYFKRLKSDYEKINKDFEILYDHKINLIEGLHEINYTEQNLITVFNDQWEMIKNLGELEEKLEFKIINLFVSSISRIIKENINIKENTLNILFDIELNCFKTNLKELQIKTDHYKRIIDGLNSEINQLENNLKFFSRSSKDSPLLKEVLEKSNTLTDELYLNTERLNKIKLVKKRIINSVKETSEKKTNIG